MKKFFLTSILVLSWGLTGIAQNKSIQKGPEPSTEQRAKMAAIHEKVAQCLRSNKTMTECHNEMMGECPAGETCSMGMGMGMWRKYDMMGRGRGSMMGKGGMMPEEEKTETKKVK